MAAFDYSPLFFGEFSPPEVRQLRLGYGLLTDQPKESDLSDIAFLMHFSRGALRTILQTPNAVEFTELPPRIIFGYSLDEDSNAYATRVLNDSKHVTYLARMNTALVRDLMNSTSELVFSLQRALFMRPFNLPKEQRALDEFGFSVDSLAIQLVFLHEFSHCTRNHLSTWSRAMKLHGTESMSESFAATGALTAGRDYTKSRIRRALELDADLHAAELLGSLYHYHVIGPDAPWYGKLTERHKLIACWVAVMAVGIAFSRISNRDSECYDPS